MSELLPAGMVTVLVADVADLARPWENQAEEMTAALAQLDRTVADLVVSHGGVRWPEQSESDDLVVAFERAVDAMACALALQRASVDPIWLRIGVHTGEARFGDEIGPTINRAARLRDVAHGQQIVLCGTTRDLVADQLPAGAWLTDLGAESLGDLTRPERVVQLCHTDFSPLLTPKTVCSHNLPPQLTTFVGRQAEMDELRRIIRDHRLVTLTGAGGIGKTRLAIEAAGQLASGFAYGMWYVDLAPITDPLVVPVTIARTLGLPDQTGRSTTDTLCRFFGDREILLLADNCEHLLDACGTLIASLLTGCPQLTILATSRAPISVIGELTWRVPSLSLNADAIDLFTDRARHARPDFRVTVDNAATIADICRRLDGMPLAIELAAARTRALSLAHILENLQDRFRLLTGGARNALQRHQTLRASVDWSHALLTEPERSLFRRLGVFVGGFDLDAAQAVSVDTTVERHQVIDHLSLLVDKSLVVAEDASGTMRYRLLETMRQYATEKLDEAGEADAARDRHRDYYTDKAVDLVSLVPGGPARLIEWADVEIDNLRAAFARSRERGDVEQGLRLASSLQPLWLARARFREGLAMFDAAVTDAPGPSVAPAVWVRAVADQSLLEAWLGEPASLDRARASVSIARKLDNPALIATALNGCAALLVYALAADTMHSYHDEAADLARASGNQRVLCETLLHQAIADNMCGELMTAHAAAEECHDLADALGDQSTSRSSQIWLGEALLLLGEVNEACRVFAPLAEDRIAPGESFTIILANILLGRAHARQGLSGPAHACVETALAATTNAGGFQEDLAYAILAEVALADGDGPAARQACETSWRHTVPERIPFIRCFNPMAEALLACGELVEARRWADDTVAIVPGCYKVAALIARAHIALAQGELEQARRDAHDALVVAAHTCSFLYLADVLECLARLAADDANHQITARVFGAADAIRDQMGVVRFQLHQTDCDAAIESSRDALGEAVFDAAWAQGAALSIDETIAYVQRGRGKRKRPTSGWESLTPTETDVVRLVREGLANKDIAARLLISRRTVQTHLTHVYNKLGLASRVQLLQEAARHT